MAEASTSTMSHLADLREAARRTMRRKQAPELPSNRIPSPPLPPRSTISTSMASTLAGSISLDYGDPMDISPTTITPNLNLAGTSSSPVTLLPNRPTRRTSRAAAKTAASTRGTDDTSREEGEISDEDNRVKESSSRDFKSLTSEVRAGIDTNAMASVMTLLKPSQNQIAQPPRRESITGGMPPPPIPPISVHREPAPISPTTSLSIATSTRAPTFPATNGTPIKARSNSAPTLQTHFFGNLSKNVNAGNINEDDEGHSPKTEALNREFFNKLLQQGIDDDHCRPGLPSVYHQLSCDQSLTAVL